MASVLGFAFTPAAVHRAAIQQNDDHEHKSADGPLVNRFYFLPKRVAIRVDIATKACNGELELIIATRSGVLWLPLRETSHHHKTPMTTLFVFKR